MKKPFYDIYRAETGHKKTYMVAPLINGLHCYACRNFHCRFEDVKVVVAWVKGQYLYLEEPEGNAKKVYAAYYERSK